MHSRRALLLASGGSALAITPALAVCSLPPDDPVFDLIAEHQRQTRACDAAFEAADRIWDVHGMRSPETIAADDKAAAAAKAANKALRALIATVPTTLAGLRATVLHVGTHGSLPYHGVEQEDLADLLLKVGHFLELEERK